MISGHHHSQISKASAQAAIDLKLSILRAWLEQGIPYQCDELGRHLLDAREQKLLEFFPKSLRQFKQWDGSQNTPFLQRTLPSMGVTGNDTLAKRPASVEQAQQLIAGLRARADSQLRSGRHATARRLQHEIAALNAALSARLAEVREQQRTIRSLQREQNQMTARQERENTEFKRILEELTSALQLERQRSSHLTTVLAKLSPLKQLGLAEERGA